MTRTRALFCLAAALTLTAALEPATRWWRHFHQAPVKVASHADATGGALRLEAALSHGRPLEGGSTYVRYSVRASDAGLEGRPQAVELALVVDRSGSMAGQKLQRARAAALALVELLHEDDQLAVVTFGSDVTELGLTRADEPGKIRLRAFINAMQDSGGTNISGALNRAQALLGNASSGAARRVVLVSDGQPTEGLTQERELVQLAVALHESKLAVSALGVGSDFNGPLMQHLAEHGGGYYAYLNDSERLTEVLQLELAQARGAVARNVSLRLTLPDGAQVVQVAGREVVTNKDEAMVPMMDFGPGQSAQAYVELRVPAGASSLQIDARLEYFDANTQCPVVSGTARLAAETTDDVKVADASKESSVASECVRAVGATQMVAAAAAFERGDRQSAFSFLGNARSIFAMSADTLAGDIDEASVTQKRWEQTHEPSAVRHEALNLGKKKMADFGMNNAY